MLIFLIFYALQLILIFLVMLKRNNECTRYQTIMKSFTTPRNDPFAPLTSDFYEHSGLIYFLLLVSTLPILGYVPLFYTIFSFKKMRQIIFLLNQKITDLNKKDSLRQTLKKIPTSLQSKIYFLKSEIEFFKEKNYHVSVVKESYAMFLDLVENSVFNDAISDASLSLIGEGVNRLEVLFKELRANLKREEHLQQQRHEQFVLDEFSKYDYVLTEIIRNAKSRQSIFFVSDKF